MRAGRILVHHDFDDTSACVKAGASACCCLPSDWATKQWAAGLQNNADGDVPNKCGALAQVALDACSIAPLLTVLDVIAV